MTWARLDDGITDRPNLLALPRGVRLVHLEGIVWACRHETDGDLPRHVLRKVTDEPEPDKAAAALVDAGLWEETDTGWSIVGFLDDQISSGDLARQRELAAVRQRRQRQHKAGDHSLCDPRYCRRAAEASRVTDAVSHTGSHGSPTRPDPTRPTREGREGSGPLRGSADAPPLAGPDEKQNEPQDILRALVSEALLEGHLDEADFDAAGLDQLDDNTAAMIADTAAVAGDFHNFIIDYHNDPTAIGTEAVVVAGKLRRTQPLIFTRESLEHVLGHIDIDPGVTAEAVAVFNRTSAGGAA